MARLANLFSPKDMTCGATTMETNWLNSQFRCWLATLLTAL